MQLSSRQSQILVGALCDIERICAGERPPACSRLDWSKIREVKEAELARENVIRTEPGRWLGKVLRPSDYVMLARDYAILEDRGLICRHSLGFDQRRQTHIELTAAGRELASQLRMEAANHA
jgi:hypothetical protein